MHTTTDLSLQLRAILDDPDDDGARIVYADLLEELGDSERAGFIRCQIALAAWPCECDSEERVYHDECRCAEKLVLQQRERELWQTTVPKGWAVGFEEIQSLCWPCHLLIPSDNLASARPDPTRSPILLVRRGFIESITLTAANFLRHADALLAAQPIMTVRLTTRPGNERWQFESEGMKVRLEGRRWRLERDIAALGRRLYPGQDTADVVCLLLHAEFPRIRTFHLPGDTTP